jgi:hypothetical protein
MTTDDTELGLPNFQKTITARTRRRLTLIEIGLLGVQLLSTIFCMPVLCIGYYDLISFTTVLGGRWLSVGPIAAVSVLVAITFVLTVWGLVAFLRYRHLILRSTSTNRISFCRSLQTAATSVSFMSFCYETAAVWLAIAAFVSGGVVISLGTAISPVVRSNMLKMIHLYHNNDASHITVRFET